MLVIGLVLCGEKVDIPLSCNGDIVFSFNTRGSRPKAFGRRQRRGLDVALRSIKWSGSARGRDKRLAFKGVAKGPARHHCTEISQSGD
jgi:hypothetical protein